MTKGRLEASDDVVRGDRAWIRCLRLLGKLQRFRQVLVRREEAALDDQRLRVLWLALQYGVDIAMSVGPPAPQVFDERCPRLRFGGGLAPIDQWLQQRRGFVVTS